MCEMYCGMLRRGPYAPLAAPQRPFAISPIASRSGAKDHRLGSAAVIV